MAETDLDVMILSLDFVIYSLLGISAFSILRIVFGPTPEDKMIGLNLMAAQVLAVLVLVAVKTGRSILLDVALVYAVLGFVGILALARYFFRGGKQG
jgi:multicomponent Na+:H+ antiporter subunit F